MDWRANLRSLEERVKIKMVLSRIIKGACRDFILLHGEWQRNIL